LWLVSHNSPPFVLAAAMAAALWKMSFSQYGIETAVCGNASNMLPAFVPLGPALQKAVLVQVFSSKTNFTGERDY